MLSQIQQSNSLIDCEKGISLKRLKAVGALGVILFFSLVSRGNAAIIDVGDIIASDFTAGHLLKIDPVTGVQTVIASGGGLVNPQGFVVENSGTILVVERSSQSILRVDLSTGQQTTISTGGSFVNILNVAVEASGQLLVSDAGGTASIYRVDPLTGIQTLVSAGGNLSNLLRGIAVDATGDILALNNSVVRIDPVTGAQAVLSSGPNYQASANIVIESSGDLLVVDRSAFSLLGGLIRVDPTNGNQTVLTSGGNFVDPFGLALEANGKIIVSDYTNDEVYRVDPITGAQSILSSAGFLDQALYLDVSHVSVSSAVPEPSSFALLALATTALLGYSLRNHKSQGCKS